MAQEKHRKSEGGYRPGEGEEAVEFLHCPCSRQQPAGTSALLLALLYVWVRARTAETSSNLQYLDFLHRTYNVPYSTDTTVALVEQVG